MIFLKNLENSMIILTQNLELEANNAIRHLLRSELRVAEIS